MATRPWTPLVAALAAGSAADPPAGAGGEHVSQAAHGQLPTWRFLHYNPQSATRLSRIDDTELATASCDA
eukprot:1820665-Pyramimonas_sp.AAC.1